MTSFRALDGLSGRPGPGSSGTQPPANAIPYSGNFLAGIVFTVLAGGCWFEGFWYHAAAGAPTAPQKFALWTFGNLLAGETAVIPGTVITSGTLSAGPNFVPLPTPVPLAIGTPYVATTGVNGPFIDTASQFGPGDPYSAGITNGPLRVYSGATGSIPCPHGLAQGVFSVAGSDVAALMPSSGDSGGDGASNFWVDIQVSNTAPPGFSGPYRLQPNSVFADDQSGTDAPADYNVAVEFGLAQPCSLGKIWFISPPGSAGLPTECAIWDVATELRIAEDAAPAWSGAAGSRWVSCSFAGVTLPAGRRLKAAAYNADGTSGSWSYKRIGFWQSFSTFRPVAPDGIVSGPLSAPGVANASLATVFGSGVIEPGQSTFMQGPPIGYPGMYVDQVSAAAQYYGIDVEVSPLPDVQGSAALTAGPVLGAAAVVTPGAGIASGAAALSAAPVLAAGGAVSLLVRASALLSAAPVLTCSARHQRITITPGNVQPSTRGVRGQPVADSYVIVSGLTDGVYDT